VIACALNRFPWVRKPRRVPTHRHVYSSSRTNHVTGVDKTQDRRSLVYLRIQRHECADFRRFARTPPPAFLFLQTTLSKSAGDTQGCEIPEPVMEPKAPPGVNAADNGLRGKSGARPASLLENDAASMQNRTQSGFARATEVYLQIPRHEVKPHNGRNFDFSSRPRADGPHGLQLHGFTGENGRGGHIVA